MEFISEFKRLEKYPSFLLKESERKIMTLSNSRPFEAWQVKYETKFLDKSDK